MTPEDSVLAACAAALDDRDVVTDPDILRSYTRDRSTGSAAGEPFAVVFPRTTEQVAAVMASAHAHRVPVVPRGAGSGLSGGSNAIEGFLHPAFHPRFPAQRPQAARQGAKQSRLPTPVAC